jgi:hypothetical protein
LWPTPAARDWKSEKRLPEGLAKRMADARGYTLPTQVMIIDGADGALNPAWVEWLMGFPAGWTDLDHSETPSSQKSQSALDGPL